MNVTKDMYLDALSAALLEKYGHDWAGDPERLRKFVSEVRRGLERGTNPWVLGSCDTVAWRALGFRGKPTYKALHALPWSPAAQVTA